MGFRVAGLLGIALTVVLVGCSDTKDKPSTQTAAKVNKEEITVHQINAVLQQQRGLKPEQAEEAGQRALQRLIDQELAVQKAAELKLDRDPRVLQSLEAARRDIIARAYIDRIGEGAAKPTAVEIKQYYDGNPALFRERRVYQLQELMIEISPDRVEGLRAKLGSSKSFPDFVAYLRASGIRFGANQAVRGAEQLPLSVLPVVAKMKDGESVLLPTADGAQVVHVAGSRPQPVDEEHASKAIEQFLLNERKRRVIADDIKALRAAAHITYVGKYAASAPGAGESVKPPTPREIAASAAAAVNDVGAISQGLGLRAGSNGASAATAVDAAVKPASGVDASSISKGLGLK